MIKIEKVHGEDQRLFDLVGRMAMDGEVLKQNNNYPFRTSSKYVWFIARNEADSVSGFFPVEVYANSSVKINNYYVEKNNAALMTRLIKEVVRTYGGKQTVRAVVLARHVEIFVNAGFFPVRESKRYSFMEYVKID